MLCPSLFGSLPPLLSAARRLLGWSWNIVGKHAAICSIPRLTTRAGWELVSVSACSSVPCLPSGFLQSGMSTGMPGDVLCDPFYGYWSQFCPLICWVSSSTLPCGNRSRLFAQTAARKTPGLRASAHGAAIHNPHRFPTTLHRGQGLQGWTQ